MSNLKKALEKVVYLNSAAAQFQKTRTCDVSHESAYENGIPEPGSGPSSAFTQQNQTPSEQHTHISYPSCSRVDASYYATPHVAAGQSNVVSNGHIRHLANYELSLAGVHSYDSSFPPGYNYDPASVATQYDSNATQQQRPCDSAPQQHWSDQHSSHIHMPCGQSIVAHSPPLQSISPTPPTGSPGSSCSYSNPYGASHIQQGPFNIMLPPRAHTVPYDASSPVPIQRSRTVDAPSYTQQDLSSYNTAGHDTAYRGDFPPPQFPPDRALTYQSNSSYLNNSTWYPSSQSAWDTTSAQTHTSQRIWGQGGTKDF